MQPRLLTGPILVTGGGGGLARALAGCEWPSGMDLIAPPRRALDICNPAQVDAMIEALAPSVVINTAAYTSVDLAEKAPASVLGVNDRGCEILSDATTRRGVKLLHVSTDFVFSGSLGQPYREMDSTEPVNAYGASKLRGEDYVLSGSSEAVVVRTSWLLGGRSGFIPAILTRALQGRGLDVVSDQIGTPTDVDDLARALRDITLRMAGSGAPRQLYHVAGPVAATWFEIASMAVEVWADRVGMVAPMVRPVTSAEWGAEAVRPTDSRLDSSAFREDFGYDLPSWRARVADWVMTFERGRT